MHRPITFSSSTAGYKLLYLTQRIRRILIKIFVNIHALLQHQSDLKAEGGFGCQGKLVILLSPLLTLNLV